MQFSKTLIVLLVIAGVITTVFFLIPKKEAPPIAPAPTVEPAQPAAVPVEGTPAKPPAEAPAQVQVPPAVQPIAAPAEKPAASVAQVFGPTPKPKTPEPPFPTKPPKPVTGCGVLSFKAEKQLKPARKGPPPLNLITLSENARKAGSHCLKINGTPTKFKLSAKKDEIGFGSVESLKAIVSLEYCIGEKIPEKKCVVPKDEFLQALTGQGEDDEGDSEAKWGGKGGSNDEQKLDQELKSFAQEIADDDANKVFATWSVVDETFPKK